MRGFKFDMRWGGALAIAAAVIFVLGLVWLAPAARAGGGDSRQSKIADSIMEPVSAAPSWTGFYVGVLGTYDRHGTEVASLLNLESKDFGYGITVGYTHKISGTMLVAGIDLDYVFQKNGNALTEMNRSWSIMPRLGLLVSPTAMLYGGLGYTSTDGSFAVPPPAPGFSLPDSGLTWALGAEAHATKHLRVRVEYRNVDMGSGKLGGVPIEGDLQTIRAGLIFSF